MGMDGGKSRECAVTDCAFLCVCVSFGGLSRGSQSAVKFFSV